MKPLPSALAATFGLTLATSADTLSPTLEVLPLNSTLEYVTIPRYDADRNRVAYLKADLMEILADGDPIGDRQPIMVDCTSLQLRMLAGKGKGEMNKSLQEMGGEVKVDMKKARYRLTAGVLTAQEEITARSPKFVLTGSGAVFHLDSRRGFLFGPLDCDIISDALAQNTTPMTTPITALLASTSLLALNPSHQPPSAEELLKVEKLARSSQASVQRTQQSMAESSAETQKQSQDADEALATFAKDVGSNSLTLLIQNPPAANPANPAKQAKPPIEDPDFSIHCDGGGFFDGNKNLLVFMRNVIVNEKRFTLKAQEEIKVFFLTEEKEGAKPGDKPGMSISDISKLVATGGIHFSGIDKDGNPVEATADTAFYDDQTKTLILKDGQPTFWTKIGNAPIHLQSEKKDAYVKVVLSEDTMRADTSPDGWTFVGKNPAPQKK